MGQQDFCRCLSILSMYIKWKGERKRERKEKINISLDRAKREKSKSKLLLIDVILWPRIKKRKHFLYLMMLTAPTLAILRSLASTLSL